MRLETINLVEMLESNDEGIGVSLYFQAVGTDGSTIMLRALGPEDNYSSTQFEEIAKDLDALCSYSNH